MHDSLSKLGQTGKEWLICTILTSILYYDVKISNSGPLMEICITADASEECKYQEFACLLESQLCTYDKDYVYYRY